MGRGLSGLQRDILRYLYERAPCEPRYTLQVYEQHDMTDVEALLGGRGYQRAERSLCEAFAPHLPDVATQIVAGIYRTAPSRFVWHHPEYFSRSLTESPEGTTYYLAGVDEALAGILDPRFTKMHGDAIKVQIEYTALDLRAGLSLGEFAVWAEASATCQAWQAKVTEKARDDIRRWYSNLLA